MGNKIACQTSNSPLPAISMVYRGGDSHHKYTLIIYVKKIKMSRKKLKKIDKFYEKIGCRILRFKRVFWGEILKNDILYGIRKVESSMRLSEAKTCRAFIFKGFQRYGFKPFKMVLIGFKGGFKGYLKFLGKIAIFSIFHDPNFTIFIKKMILEV